MSRRTSRLWLALITASVALHSPQTNGMPVQIADADPPDARHRS